jgi:hypothetical protein
MRPSRLMLFAIVLKASTLLHLHQILTKRKYRLLFSPKGRRKPGPKGPSQELIDTILATKQGNSLPAKRSADCFGVRRPRR